MKIEKSKKLVVAGFDIETMPNLVRTWRKWEQNVIWYERPGYIWSISWQVLGSKKIYHKNITDFHLYKKDKYSDKALVEFIWNLFNTWDIIIAHNGRAFDTKTITGRFVHYRLPPVKPYKQIDTKVLYKTYMNEDSNSLKDICEKHDLPHKRDTGGYELWRDCENGDKKAIAKMKWYNNGDIVSLIAAYELIKPYSLQHPNVALAEGHRHGCPRCGGLNMIKNGTIPKMSGNDWQQWKCTDCFTYHSSPMKEGSQIR